MSSEAKGDIKAFVAEYSFLLTKDRICELGVKSLYTPDVIWACFDKLDRDSLIGIGGPLSHSQM